MREGRGLVIKHKSQLRAQTSRRDSTWPLVLCRPSWLLALGTEVRVTGYLCPFPTSQPSLALMPHETHHLQFGAGEDFAFVPTVGGAALCRVVGLQGEC